MVDIVSQLLEGKTVLVTEGRNHTAIPSSCLLQLVLQLPVVVFIGAYRSPSLTNIRILPEELMCRNHSPM
jgi:hypothetical protein